MRKITSKKYAQALYESLEGKDKTEIANAITSFIQLLVRNKSISKSDKVISAFYDYLKEQEGIQTVSVYSAKALHLDEKNEIKSGINQALNKEIELTEYVNPELIGGAILKYGDVIVDGSVKSKIENLANTIG